VGGICYVRFVILGDGNGLIFGGRFLVEVWGIFDFRNILRINFLLYLF
jgi:hypothetical protein